MKFILATLIVLLVNPEFALAKKKASNYELLARDYGSAGQRLFVNEDWLGIDLLKGKQDLIPTKMTCSGSKEGTFCKPYGEFLRGEGFVKGPVEGVSLVNQMSDFAHLEGPVEFSLLNRKYRIQKVDSGFTISEMKNRWDVKDSCSLGDCGLLVKPIWAGDLNRNGKLDLIVRGQGDERGGIFLLIDLENRKPEEILKADFYLPSRDPGT